MLLKLKKYAPKGGTRVSAGRTTTCSSSTTSGGTSRFSGLASRLAATFISSRASPTAGPALAAAGLRSLTSLSYGGLLSARITASTAGRSCRRRTARPSRRETTAGPGGDANCPKLGKISRCIFRHFSISLISIFGTAVCGT